MDWLLSLIGFMADVFVIVFMIVFAWEWWQDYKLRGSDGD